MRFFRTVEANWPAGVLALLVVAAAWSWRPARCAVQDSGASPQSGQSAGRPLRPIRAGRYGGIVGTVSRTGAALSWPRPANQSIPIGVGRCRLRGRLNRLEAEVAELREDQPSVFTLEHFARQFRSDGPREYPTVHWSGFLQVDSGWFIQDSASKAAVGDFEDKLGLRHVRLRAYGNIRRATSYVIDLDFAAAGHPVSAT